MGCPRPSIPHDPSTKGNSHRLMGNVPFFHQNTDSLIYIFNVFKMCTSDLGHPFLNSWNWKKNRAIWQKIWTIATFLKLDEIFEVARIFELKIGSKVSPPYTTKMIFLSFHFWDLWHRISMFHTNNLLDRFTATYKCYYPKSGMATVWNTLSRLYNKL